MNLTFVFQLAGIGFLALMLSYLGVAILRRWAERCQILDIPNERSSHTLPTPRGGGVAIVFFSLIGFVAAWLYRPIWPFSVFLIYLAGGVLIASVSWLDDLHPLPNRIRFSAHCLCAILAIFGFGYFRSISIPFLGQLHLGWIGLLITFLWIVGLTNAYNFMDGIDGIAGGQGVIAGFGWAVLGWVGGQTLIAIIGLLLAATSMGFLGHNWPPARIFMGDVGSAFLGYTFAALPIIAIQNDPRFSLIGAILVWPFIFDTTLTFLGRLQRGENVFTAHRSHLYQRLVIAGYGHRFVTLLYMGLALMGTILAFLWFMEVDGSELAISAILPLFCFCLWTFVLRKERKHATKK